jgi:hypothetical protein
MFFGAFLREKAAFSAENDVLMKNYFSDNE